MKEPEAAVLHYCSADTHFQLHYRGTRFESYYL